MCIRSERDAEGLAARLDRVPAPLLEQVRRAEMKSRFLKDALPRWRRRREVRAGWPPALALLAEMEREVEGLDIFTRDVLAHYP